MITREFFVEQIKELIKCRKMNVSGFSPIMSLHSKEGHKLIVKICQKYNKQMTKYNLVLEIVDKFENIVFCMFRYKEQAREERVLHIQKVYDTVIVEENDPDYVLY